MPEPTLFFAWWNLENLFHPVDADHPASKTIPRLTEAQFEKKVANQATIIRKMNDGKGPDLLGVCEVEEEAVLKRVIDALADDDYSIAYHESSDPRGIDVGFIYRKSALTYDKKKSRAYHIVKRRDTRDIFEVAFTLKAVGKELYALGNHWPSRSGGQYESEPFRMMVAENASVAVTRILQEASAQEQPEPAILVLGDFNDEPFNRSIQEYLLGIRDRKRVASKRSKNPYLYNCMWRLLGESNAGTFYYSSGASPWNMLDQVFVSRSLLGGGPLTIDESSVTIFKTPEMQQKNGAPLPFRQVGNKWLEGYSDHFPVVGRVRIGN